MLQGRPYGGCAIFWKKSFSPFVKRIDSKCERIAAISLSYDDYTVLIVCVYMPVDPRVLNVDSCEEYSDVLNAVSECMVKSDADYFIIGGDLNTDLSRRSAHCHLLSDFVQLESLSLCVDSNVNFTFRNSLNQKSNIDHFLISQNLDDCVRELATSDDGDNLSHHLPVSLSLDFATQRVTSGASNSNFDPCYIE